MSNIRRCAILNILNKYLSIYIYNIYIQYNKIHIIKSSNDVYNDFPNNWFYKEK